MTLRLALAAAIPAVAIALAPVARADEVADFYKGKQVTLLVAAGPGASFGIRAQLLARHFGRHMAGQPTAVPQFMPGAGGRKAANYLYEASAKDGSVIGLIFANTAQAQLLQPKGARYDARRFQYLGSHSPVWIVSFVWHAAPATTIDGMKANQVIMGSSGLNSPSGIQPNFLNNLVGTKLKIVTGYSGANAVFKAMETGEVHGGTVDWDTIASTRPDWVAAKKVIPFILFATGRLPALKDVPTPVELAATEDDRRIARFMSIAGDIGHTYAAPPGVPPARVAALRKALAAMFADPAFRDAAEKAKVPAEPVPAEKVEALVTEAMSLPPALVTRAQALAGFKPEG